MTRSNLVYFDRNHNDHELMRMVNRNHDRRKQDEERQRRAKLVQKLCAALIAGAALWGLLWIATC